MVLQVLRYPSSSLLPKHRVGSTKLLPCFEYPHGADNLLSTHFNVLNMHICNKKMQEGFSYVVEWAKTSFLLLMPYDPWSILRFSFFLIHLLQTCSFFWVLFSRYRSHIQDKRPMHLFSITLLLKWQWKGKKVRQRYHKNCFTKTQQQQNPNKQTGKEKKKRRRAANKTWLCTSISCMGCAAPTCHQKEAAFPLSDMNTGFAYKSSALKCGSLIQ